MLFDGCVDFFALGKVSSQCQRCEMYKLLCF
jgi:hypothetical protein